MIRELLEAALLVAIVAYDFELESFETILLVLAAALVLVYGGRLYAQVRLFVEAMNRRDIEHDPWE